MYKDINRQDVQDIIDGKIAQSPILSPLKEDFGVQTIAYESAFKIDEVGNTFGAKLTEFYRPESEIVLLSRLMYEIGYLRFQKPLRIQTTVKSELQQEVTRWARFTDGVSVFMTENATVLEKDTPQKISLVLGTRREFTQVVDKDVMYFKIPLKTTYRKMYDFNIYRDNKKIEWSQGFIKDSADVSLEVDIDGNIIVVVRLNNVHGKNIVHGETLTIEVFETTPSDTVPKNLALIGALHTVCEEISKERSYEPYLSILDMANIILYNKNINNSLVYNEDFKGHILAHIQGIEAIKVWQQEEEDKETGAKECNVNKIFCSYIPKISGQSFDTQITDLIKSSVHGRFIFVKNPMINEVVVSIYITNNTKKFIPDMLKKKLQDTISGHYDGRGRILTSNTIYKETVKVLDDYDLDIHIEIGNKDIYKNNIFYKVSQGKTYINVTERG